MTEAGDYNPGPWKGYDFGRARKSYDTHAGRSYDDAVASRKANKDLLEERVQTKSTAPVVVVCDVTGSMKDWPSVIFSKLPYLELEGREYLGKDLEICFAAVGDAYCDKYPLQVRPFDSGRGLEKRLKELVIEGNGGGQVMETYELAALYFARKAELPNAVKPILIFIGDEKPYDFVDRSQAEDYLGIKLDKRLSSREIFRELQRKFSVYLVRKPYEERSGDSMSRLDCEIAAEWESHLGADHVSYLPEAGRVVDVIFGIFAKETGRVPYFRDELSGRQTAAQTKTVLKALESIHGPAPQEEPEGKSVMRAKASGKPSKSLV